MKRKHPPVEDGGLTLVVIGIVICVVLLFFVTVNEPESRQVTMIELETTKPELPDLALFDRIED